MHVAGDVPSEGDAASIVLDLLGLVSILSFNGAHFMRSSFSLHGVGPDFCLAEHDPVVVVPNGLILDVVR